MDKIEEVKKILDSTEYELTHGCCIVDKNRMAKEICQLFEPKPDEGRLPPIISWERIRMVLQEQDRAGVTDNMFRLEAIAKAQRDLTASIKDRECIERCIQYEDKLVNLNAICQARIGALQFEIMEYFRNYVRQWEKKGIGPTFGCIWDMIRCAGKEDFKATHLKRGK